MKAVIAIDKVSKSYRIGTRRANGYQTLRDTLAEAASASWRKLGGLARRFSGPRSEPASGEAAGSIWALREVSFGVRPGEVVGLIGRNGAGKSTLLKILSQIVEPTDGRVELRGRIGSLLEVGTGFHPELTGRENIYLNGAILGMKRHEITRKFDEIVAFAGVEKFLETPVKRYSSGMYVRLAFAVAAHLEPEVLLVDEVLAVGDVEFQKKCLGKLHDVGKEGRTVLFVSHNLAALQTLCRRGVVLRDGQVYADDSIDGAIRTYLQSIEQNAFQKLSDRTDRAGQGKIKLVDVEIHSSEEGISTTLATGRPARFLFHVNGVQPGLSCIFTIYDQRGLPVAHFNSAVHSPEDTQDTAIGSQLLCELDELPLYPGRYRINVAIRLGVELQDHVEGARFFDVEQGAFRGRPTPSTPGYGNVCLHHRWKLPI
jgi:lipopolysaccharide transport system ATP-binding protein